MTSPRRSRPSSFECPHCGEQVPAGRLACPECGSDQDTGWQDPEELDYAAVEIPDFYADPEANPRRRSWWWVVAAALAVWAALWIAFVW